MTDHHYDTTTDPAEPIVIHLADSLGNHRTLMGENIRGLVSLRLTNPSRVPLSIDYLGAASAPPAKARPGWQQEVVWWAASGQSRVLEVL